MKKNVNAFDYAGHILEKLPKGILLTTKSGDEVNSMVIGWGHIGIEWGKPIFTAYVRNSRHTRKLLSESGEFTVNIPMDEIDSNVIAVCGRKSGRDMDKIRELGLHLEASQVVSAPGIRELPLTLECKVIYKQDQEPVTLPADVQQKYYPDYQSGDPQIHVAYYGEIVNAYMIEK